MTAKEQVQKMIERLPEDSTLEEIQYHVYVYGKIQKGLAAIERGEVVSHDEVKLRMSKWLKK